MNQRIKRIGFFVLLLAIAIIAPCFSLFKFAKNPSEFREESKSFATIEVSVSGSRILLDQMKVGDIHYNQNGEEIVRLLSLSDPKPRVTGVATFNGGNYVNIIDPNTEDRTAILRARCHKVGGLLYGYSSCSVLGAGHSIDFNTKGYTVNCNILKVIKIDNEVVGSGK